jgi:hypothetical protein
MAIRGSDLNPAARRELVAGYAAAVSAAREAEGDDLGAAIARSSALQERYLATLPRPELSRCPFTEQVFTHSVDTGGLDGPWWQYENPLRPSAEALDLIETLFAFTGALRLGEPLELFSYLCKPGPEAPFVVPRILSHDSVRAVVSHVRVGPHTGFPIVYFAEEPPEIERFNTWGTDHYDTYTGWDSMEEDSEPVDFDLESWIERDKLLWIAPGDDRLELRSGLNGCPYVGLPGRRTFLRIQAGVVSDGPALPTP